MRVRAGDADGSCVVETAMDDRPFIVDSVLEFFHKHAIPVRVLLHPVFQMSRAPPMDRSFPSSRRPLASMTESFTHAEIELPPDSRPLRWSADSPRSSMR